jgi:hypothetical protein
MANPAIRGYGTLRRVGCYYECAHIHTFTTVRVNKAHHMGVTGDSNSACSRHNAATHGTCALRRTPRRAAVRRAAGGRRSGGLRAGGGHPAGATPQGGIHHAYAMGEGGYGGTLIEEAEKTRQQRFGAFTKLIRQISPASRFLTLTFIGGATSRQHKRPYS